MSHGRRSDSDIQKPAVNVGPDIATYARASPHERDSCAVFGQAVLQSTTECAVVFGQKLGGCSLGTRPVFSATEAKLRVLLMHQQTVSVLDLLSRRCVVDSR